MGLLCCFSPQSPNAAVLLLTQTRGLIQLTHQRLAVILWRLSEVLVTERSVPNLKKNQVFPKKKKKKKHCEIKPHVLLTVQTSQEGHFLV